MLVGVIIQKKTDGMYGDMPDGFDDDYSFLGH